MLKTSPENLTHRANSCSRRRPQSRDSSTNCARWGEPERPPWRKRPSTSATASRVDIEASSSRPEAWTTRASGGDAFLSAGESGVAVLAAEMPEGEARAVRLRHGRHDQSRSQGRLPSCREVATIVGGEGRRQAPHGPGRGRRPSTLGRGTRFGSGEGAKSCSRLARREWIRGLVEAARTAAPRRSGGGTPSRHVCSGSRSSKGSPPQGRPDSTRREPDRGGSAKSAFRLLEADALLTYACEAALESEEPVAALRSILAVVGE